MTPPDAAPPGPQRFRKKPVVIEAARVPLAYADETCNAFFEELQALGANDSTSRIVLPQRDHLIIRKLEGDMRAEPGDWIIRDVKGELYPCKPDIFEATYERA
jgi:hypothetical protein